MNTIRRKPLTTHRCADCGETFTTMRGVLDHVERSCPERQKRCSHKFIDSKFCLKCGWEPPYWVIPNPKTQPEEFKRVTGFDPLPETA